MSDELNKSSCCSCCCACNCSPELCSKLAQTIRLIADCLEKGCSGSSSCSEQKD